MKHTVSELKLDNGAKGLLVHTPGALVVDTYITFNAGFVFSSPDKFELPHVFEHTMFTTNKYPSKNQFSVEFEKNGAYINAFTSDNQIGYDYQCARFENERIFELVANQLTDPLFSEEELLTELGNVEEELSEYLSDHSRLSRENLYTAMTERVDLAERIAQLPSITPDDLVAHYRRTHSLKNLRFLVIGDIERAQLETVFTEKFQPLKTGKKLKVPEQKLTTLAKPLVASRDVPQIYYYLHNIHSERLSFRELTAAKLLNRLLTDGFRSRIFGQIRERGLAYGIYSRIGADVHESYFELGGFVSPKNYWEVFEVVQKEVKAVLAGDFTEAELDDFKLKAKGVFARRFQTPRDLVNWYSDYTLYEQCEDFFAYPELVDSITKEEAIAAFTKVCNDKIWGLSFVGKINQAEAEKVHDLLSGIWS